MEARDVNLEIDLRWREGGFEINIDYDDPAQAADKRVLGERIVFSRFLTDADWRVTAIRGRACASAADEFPARAWS
jgi:hypothetical protein